MRSASARDTALLFPDTARSVYQDSATRKLSMCVPNKNGQIADAIVARPAPEVIVKSQSRERSKSARAAPRDHAAVAIHHFFLREVSCAVDAILNIHDPPVRVEAFAIAASESGTAPIVHVQNGNAAAGPILNAEIERAGCRAGGGPAMTLDQI